MYHAPASRHQQQQQAPALLVLITLFLSLAAEFVPWPGFIVPLKPHFPLLAVVYWAVHRPRLVNYAAAVLIGVIVDLADQAPLGFNAMSFTTAVLMVNVFKNRFILLFGVAQAMHVFIVLAAAQLCLYLLGYLEGEASQPPLEWHIFLPSFSAALLWLLLPAFVRTLRGWLFGKRDSHADY